jgi:NADH:ubiquinone oxidoreductase subunit 5 (subunit L)/multisubunit Na+/H+ antiporter MnhA subunit
MYDSSAALSGAIGLFLLIIVAVGIGITVLYILTLQKALSRCAPQNRTTSPESTWFLLIPLFNLVWPFILYPHISESLEREFRQRNLPIEPQPAKTLGMALAIFQACCIVPVLNILAGIGALVCFILYWIKISGYSNQLTAAAVAYYPQPTQPQWTPQPPLAAAAAAQQSPLPQARHCTACGASIQPNERFCGSCGKSVA